MIYRNGFYYLVCLASPPALDAAGAGKSQRARVVVVQRAGSQSYVGNCVDRQGGVVVQRRSSSDVHIAGGAVHRQRRCPVQVERGPVLDVHRWGVAVGRGQRYGACPAHV